LKFLALNVSFKKHFPFFLEILAFFLKKHFSIFEKCSIFLKKHFPFFGNVIIFEKVEKTKTMLDQTFLDFNSELDSYSQILVATVETVCLFEN